MSTLTGVEIFRSGTHTDSAGRTRSWSEADLDKLSEFNGIKDKAPLVIGHPKDNHPAFGWVSRIYRKGQSLWADFDQVSNDFVQMLKDGRYKERSISINKDGSLRHIGFLGAMPPAVKGLENINFSVADENTLTTITVDFSVGNERENNMTLEEALKQIEELKRKIAELEAGKDKTEFETKLKELADQVKAAEEGKAKAEKEHEDFKAQVEEENLDHRFKALSDSGRLTPSDANKFKEFAQALPDSELTMDFADSDGKTEKVSPREAYIRNFEALPENDKGLLGEFATQEKFDALNPHNDDLNADLSSKA